LAFGASCWPAPFPCGLVGAHFDLYEAETRRSLAARARDP